MGSLKNPKRIKKEKISSLNGEHPSIKQTRGLSAFGTPSLAVSSPFENLVEYLRRREASDGRVSLNQLVWCERFDGRPRFKTTSRLNFRVCRVGNRLKHDFQLQKWEHQTPLLLFVVMKCMLICLSGNKMTFRRLAR